MGQAPVFARVNRHGRFVKYVHGADAQRCDVKSGDPDRLPEGRGPQGDLMKIYNYVRAVRDISST